MKGFNYFPSPIAGEGYKIFGKCLIWVLFFSVNVAFAQNRPTISFNGQIYYLAQSYYEVDYTHSPLNVIEVYLPEGQTSDTYTKSVKRITFLQVPDFKASGMSRLHEFLEDNRDIPYEKIENSEGKRFILKVSFWWPFRANVLRKEAYVFAEDTIAKRAMCYVITELQFNDLSKVTHEDLKKQGKTLLLDDKIVKEAENLTF